MNLLECAWQELLKGDVDLERPGRYQHRANLVRCAMSRADLLESGDPHHWIGPHRVW